MPFERFTQTGRGYKPKISITKSGLIGFNQGAVRHFKLTDYEFAVLYYDRDESRIGIGLTSDKNENGICKLRKRASGADVSAKSFFDYYDINYRESKRYDAEWHGDEEKIIVNLRSE